MTSLFSPQNFSAKKGELKFAIIFALIATIILTAVVLWASFFQHDEQATEIKKSSAIQVIQRPETTTQPRQKDEIPNQQKTISKPIEKEVAKPATKTSHHTSQIVMGQGNLFVQVGAFKQAELARLMLEKMKAKYKYAKIFPKANSYAVWVGPVITRNDADKLKKHIQRQDNIKGFVTSEK